MSLFFLRLRLLKLINAFKRTYQKSLHTHASVYAVVEVSHCMLTVRRPCSSDWSCSQSQWRTTARESTTDVAWGFWEGLPYITYLCCFAQWLRFCLPQPSNQTTNLSPWLNNKSGMNKNHCLLCVVVQLIKTLLMLRYW